MPPRGPAVTQFPIIPCERSNDFNRVVIEYADALKAAAHTIGAHGMTTEQFQASGLFRAAVERLRGQNAATMADKRAFVAAILDFLRDRRHIEAWRPAGGEDRHDYVLHLPNGRVAVIEAKGCLDGNNTNIFQRPRNADEFIIWSLCQNPGADPRHNLWSGVHTRLSAEMMHRGQHVDGLIVWDMVCGTVGRPCPKLRENANRATEIGQLRVPPPCIYLFPRTIPDARNNPQPRCWTLPEVACLDVFHRAFNGNEADIVEVHITADMRGATVCRTTRLVRGEATIYESEPTPILRAV